ncbi:MAG: MerR family transcriptional regulator [Desulfomonilaceae bacterium]
MKTLYSATAAARLLQINPARLQRWLNYGHFKPEYRALLGDVEARLLTEEEIQRLKGVMDLINGGVPVQQAFAQISSDELERTVTIEL